MQHRFVARFDQQDPWSPGTLVARFVANLAGLWLASEVIPGIHIGDWGALLAGTVIFAIVNILLRPLATLASCCLIVATFGLFLLVVNAVLLGVSAWLARHLGLDFTIDGFWSAFLGALVITLVSLLASTFINRPRRRML